jgi:molecular chaperone IbpA
MKSAYTWPGSSWTVGLDSMLNRIEKLNNQESGYPPHNLIQYEPNSYTIEVAVAGFSQDDITVEQEENILTISSRDVISDETGKVFHKGIATRRFKKQFTLGDHIEVTEVTLVNGILTVSLERFLPEEKKPKRFEIRSEAQFLQE